jgi:hypothetical protein
VRVGWVLDWGGRNATAAWSAAFVMVALIMPALLLFVAMRPRGLAGDRGASS